MIPALLVGLIVFVSFLVIDGQIRRRKQSQSVLERAVADVGMHYDMSGGQEALVSLDREKSDQAKSMEQLLSSVGVDVKKTTDKLKSRFGRAGILSPDAPIYYLFFQRVASIVLVGIGLLFLASNAGGMEYVLHAMLGVIVIVIGLFGPYLYVENMIIKRAKLLQNSFPDALDLLLVCVESGLALDAAMARVCAELGAAHPEITQELNRTRLELALLNDRVTALNNLGDRTGLVCFRSLIAALIQTEKFGTSLADTLRVLSEDFRMTRLLDAENRAGRIPTLMTIPLICLLLPSFILIILGPSILRVMAQGGIFGNG